MNTEEFWRSKELNNLDRVVFSFLQSHIISNAKELAAGLDISEPTAKRALLNLKKLELIKKVKVSNLISLNNESIKSDTFENQESVKNDPLSLKKESNLIPFNEKKINSDPFFKKPTYIYITTDLININRSIYIEEGKSSLTSFASTSLKYFTTKFNSVNDLDHKELNSIQNSLTPTEPAKTDLAEIAKAPAKRKRAKAQFIPPTVEEVAAYMKEVKAERIIKQSNLQFFNVEDQAENYMDHYGAEHHWHKGKELMKDWKAAARIWIRNFKGAGTYAKKRQKNQEAIEEIFGKGLEPETNIIDAVQTENADGSLLYDASTSNQITAQPAEEETELSAAEYIKKFKQGELK